MIVLFDIFWKRKADVSVFLTVFLLLLNAFYSLFVNFESPKLAKCVKGMRGWRHKTSDLEPPIEVSWHQRTIVLASEPNTQEYNTYSISKLIYYFHWCLNFNLFWIWNPLRSTSQYIWIPKRFCADLQHLFLCR